MLGRNLIINDFPGSVIDPFLITSLQTGSYNCIAWAYGDDSKWYWPDSFSFWPTSIPKVESIEAFILLFEGIGYQLCHDDLLIQDVEKIAIYADSDGFPTHASKQLKNGYWSSKLGRDFDVSHTIGNMHDGPYGSVRVFMSRSFNKIVG